MQLIINGLLMLNKKLNLIIVKVYQLLKLLLKLKKQVIVKLVNHKPKDLVYKVILMIQVYKIYII